jgi:2-polyprenyl-6-methoxyphenol hydroxylase-like FAD-dependent oxidoreductase
MTTSSCPRTTTPTIPLSKVIVVGAGPSGLLLTILLARAGIPVELLEMTRALDTNPRASHYADSSCREFERAGVLDTLISRGFFPNGVSWRKMDKDRTRIVRLINT